MFHCGDVNFLDINFPEWSHNLNHGLVGRVHGSFWWIAGPKVVWIQTTLNDFCNHMLVWHHVTSTSPPLIPIIIHTSSHLVTSVLIRHIPPCPLIPCSHWMLASTISYSRPVITMKARGRVKYSQLILRWACERSDTDIESFSITDHSQLSPVASNSS
jgi:hypothetical protein